MKRPVARSRYVHSATTYAGPDRIELIAWRILRLTREEAVYWLSRATQYGDAPNRWAQSGMRVMLGGQPGDDEIVRMLQEFREQ